ncbi:response regulator transcription factor [Streptomyces fractus]|uniref:response regulator transcription factor n=1 Tax=Streptomyces fractus TaxID=641806 RepID=UPI003CF8CCA5
MSDTHMIKVAVVDDQELIREGTKAILETADDIRIVGEAEDGATAVPMCREAQPDVVLMDLHMPRIGGVTATRRLLSLEPAPRVIALTTLDDDEAILSVLEAGAVGYLLKQLRPVELLQAVRTAAVGGTVFADPITKRLISRSRKIRGQGMFGDAAERLGLLGDREREVLACLGQGMTNADIAAQLFMSPSSVKTYVSRMLAKLALDNRTQAALLAQYMDMDMTPSAGGYEGQPTVH